ncbi:hypothetical protein [Paracidovorax oryzae]|uniref:hypothetical protein n=1 Tax=Paracidovorax oryzae TaxID=862720 RepID=UPI00035D4AAB|nr:hypothetical protein [Paracidovorax oryzae]
MHDIPALRKTMLWSTPLFIGISASCVWATLHGVVPVFQGIAARAPVVRIAHAAQLAPFVAVVCIMAMVLGAMRVALCREAAIAKFERAFTIVVLACGLVMLLIPVTSIAQHYYMPSIGYTPCHALQGQPTRWFTDWVRDPAFCVKGKSPDWVNEQVRRSPP